MVSINTINLNIEYLMLQNRCDKKVATCIKLSVTTIWKDILYLEIRADLNNVNS